ncbi:MAG: DUF1295 domain-containing protein [Cyclobacteriaceae bacterium]
MALQQELEAQGSFLFKHRGTLPVVGIVGGLIVYAVHRAPDQLPVGEFTYELICLSVALVGQIIRAYTVGSTPPRTSGRNTNKQVADTLNTRGIYSIVRHPLYLGNLFMWLGIAMMSQHVWFVLLFLLIYWVYYERIMYTEEQFLQRKFQHDFIEWSSKTPAIIPVFKQFSSAQHPFQWVKVLRKEKNGLAALFILIEIYHSLGLWMDNQTWKMDFWGWAMVLAVLYYTVIKIQNKLAIN